MAASENGFLQIQIQDQILGSGYPGILVPQKWMRKCGLNHHLLMNLGIQG